jgi:hypothetical protein
MKNNYAVPCSTPFPNVLIEQVMPKLRDTEWRVLVVIVRATLGWIDQPLGQRKRRAWITNGELRRRTGRASSAVSLAVSNLVRSRLIEVTDAAGTFLPTASVRRRCRGRLYFNLHPVVLGRLLAK